MKSFGALLVSLFCLSAAWAAQGERGSVPVEPGTPSLPDIWDQLEKLGSLVAEQRERLRHMEEEANAQRAQLSTAETSVSASVNQLQDLLTFSSLFLQGESLRHNCAFSAGLSHSGDVGPFDSDTTVVYDREFIDLSGEYNPSTGFYRIPVGGVYHFRLSAAYIAPPSSENQCIQIYTVYGTMEPASLFHVCGSNNPGQVNYVSHVFTASLSRTRTVSVRLPAGWKLSNKNSNHNVFSGALVHY